MATPQRASVSAGEDHGHGIAAFQRRRILPAPGFPVAPSTHWQLQPKLVPAAAATHHSTASISRAAWRPQMPMRPPAADLQPDVPAAARGARLAKVERALEHLDPSTHTVAHLAASLDGVDLSLVTFAGVPIPETPRQQSPAVREGPGSKGVRHGNSGGRPDSQSRTPPVASGLPAASRQEPGTLPVPASQPGSIGLWEPSDSATTHPVAVAPDLCGPQQSDAPELDAPLEDAAWSPAIPAGSLGFADVSAWLLAAGGGRVPSRAESPAAPATVECQAEEGTMQLLQRILVDDFAAGSSGVWPASSALQSDTEGRTPAGAWPAEASRMEAGSSVNRGLEQGLSRHSMTPHVSRFLRLGEQRDAGAGTAPRAALEGPSAQPPFSGAGVPTDRSGSRGAGDGLVPTGFPALTVAVGPTEGLCRSCDLLPVTRPVGPRGGGSRPGLLFSLCALHRELRMLACKMTTVGQCLPLGQAAWCSLQAQGCR
jgi:hypothetical protein